MKFIKEMVPYVIIVLIVVLIRTFIITPVRVVGSSMYPTLEDSNIILLKKYDKNYERFDVVVFYRNNERLIKRIIGLPGETIEYKDNNLYINDLLVEDIKLNIKTTSFNKVTIPNDSYFVLGDNRIDSLDSRIIGVISKKDIIGTSSFSLFPFKKFN